MKNPFTSIRLFYKETMTELKKATWPTKTELRDSTIVVLLATVLLGSFIALRDSTVVVLLATVLLGTFIALSDFSLLNGVEFLTSLVR